MHIYRICLIVLHIGSTLTYFPHLVNHIKQLRFELNPIRYQLAYITYWISYTVLVIGVLIWCLNVVCRRNTIWQIIQVSAYVLIGKLFYSLSDLIVRLLLHYTYFVIIFDILHVIILIPAIIITYLFVERVKSKTFNGTSSQLNSEHKNLSSI